MNTLLCIQSHYGKPGLTFQLAAERPDAIVIRQPDLRASHFDSACGLITTMHLDQIGFMDFTAELEAFMDRGGRWFFNGHIMRPFLNELQDYIPAARAGLDGLQLSTLNSHSIFDGIDRATLQSRKGVAGFYGRGHNPMPQGATAVTGVGPEQAPLDWVWKRPLGGELFSHAGNDLPGTCEDESDSRRLAANIIAWVMTSGERAA
ncbi:MAG TPA: hypothetical protein DD979_01770 [Gammaproteobacteria bacterium]|jgi:hypothetical protein|nr:hypothetical protein [Gammaproteobacteria bacterium]